jgi:rubredoxin
MPLNDDDYRLSMAVAARPKQPRPGDETLRTLLIHRLSDTTKLIWRRALRFDNMGAFCEPCQRWTIRIEEDHDEIDTRWHCPECNRRYRLEFAVFEEVDPE